MWWIAKVLTNIEEILFGGTSLSAVFIVSRFPDRHPLGMLLFSAWFSSMIVSFITALVLSFLLSKTMLAVGIILLVFSGAIFFYWLKGTTVEPALRPAVFMASLGPTVILLISIILTILGLVFVVLGLL